jgi:hypothetical protein
LVAGEVQRLQLLGLRLPETEMASESQVR